MKEDEDLEDGEEIKIGDLEEVVIGMVEVIEDMIVDTNNIDRNKEEQIGKINKIDDEKTYYSRI